MNVKQFLLGGFKTAISLRVVILVGRRGRDYSKRISMRQPNERSCHELMVLMSLLSCTECKILCVRGITQPWGEWFYQVSCSHSTTWFDFVKTHDVKDETLWFQQSSLTNHTLHILPLARSQQWLNLTQFSLLWEISNMTTS